MIIKLDKMISLVVGWVVAYHYFGWWGAFGWYAIFLLVGGAK